MQNYGIFCQFRSKFAITQTIAIKWKEKYDAVVVDCHHCGDRMEMSFFFWETPTSPWVLFRVKVLPLWRLFCPSRPLAYSLLLILTQNRI